MTTTECAAEWQDDRGKDHECYDDGGHTGGHECGCGARVPRWLLDAATGDLTTVRRREWTAAYRDAADRLANIGLSRGADALRDLADQIEAGATPWATEQADAPAQQPPERPTGPEPGTGTPDAQTGSQGAVQRWRVGRSWGVTIVAETPGQPDRLAATAQTPEDAQRIVAALNAATHQTADQHKHVPDGSSEGDAPKSADAPDHWHVTTCGHTPLTDTQRDALFTAVAAAAEDWEPDGVDVQVTGTTCRCLDTPDGVQQVAQRNRQHLADTLRLLEQVTVERDEADAARDEAQAQMLREVEARVAWMRRTEDARAELAELAELRAHAEATDNALADVRYEVELMRTEHVEMRRLLKDARAHWHREADERQRVQPVIDAARTWRAASTHGSYYEARQALFAAIDRHDQEEGTDEQG